MNIKNKYSLIVSINIKKVLILFLFVVVPFFLQASIILPELFTDNMMFQRNQDIVVWGKANNKESVSIDFNNKYYTVTANNAGDWEIRIPAMSAGGPYQMVVTGQNSIKISNILIGDIWVCSGQSNMAMSVLESNNCKKEIESANYPTMRLFRVYETMAAIPQKDIAGEGWSECGSESIAQFSAVAYFFGRELIYETDVPIGLIGASWGGSNIETWISKEGFKGENTLEKIADSVQYVDLEKEKRTKNKANLEWMEDYRSRDMGSKNGEYVWATNTGNYCDWDLMNIPTYWEKELGYSDGIVWFRKSFILTEKQATNDALISLGPISHTDITWVNGTKVGGIDDFYNKLRKYKIKSGVLKPGKNEVVVRVENHGWSGGIYGAENQIFLVTGNEKISLAGKWKYKIGALAKKPRVGEIFYMNSLPTLLYNAMIAPLVKFPIKGAIWYQGESNEDNAFQYRGLLKRLIADWRQKWGIGDFPFLFVQLPNFMQPVDSPGESKWAVMRESQDVTLSLPNTGMACTIDLGEMYDIHPKNKQDVGYRLALSALKIAYGKDIINSGPRFENAEIEGNKVFITFMQVGEGLKIKDKYGCLKGFTLAGQDKIFKWAKAELINKTTVSIYCPGLEKPVAVRYGWASNPDQANLYNSANLPTNPFRTDEWQVITFREK